MVFIYTTNECHRTCDHCYWSEKQGKMSIETGSRVSNWITKICNEEGVKQLRVAFIGGEPLNNIDVILHIMNLLDAQLKGTGSLFPDGRYNCFTNGDLITNDILQSFKEHKTRIMLNPTYDPLSIVEDKIKNILSICKGCSLAIALNDVNMGRIPELAELAMRNKCHLRINRLYDGGKDPKYIQDYTKQMHKVFDILLKSERPMWPNWIMESTYPTWKGPKNPYSCGRWLVVIDTDGKLRSCNPDPDTIVGHIDTIQNWKEIKAPQRWSAKNLEECQGCQWVTICQGGCPYSRKLTYGTYNKRTPFCSAFKVLFPRLLELAEKWERYSSKNYICSIKGDK